LVLVDKAAEQVARRTRSGSMMFAISSSSFRRQLVERRQLYECPVRPVLVVMVDVDRENALEMAVADDQEP
jgi:hypothetical protein